MIRVLLVDDQRLVRAGIRMLCESVDDVEVVGEASDGAEAVRLDRSLLPGVVMMDLRMPRMDGVEATRRILASRPTARVVALTTFDDDDHVYPVLEAGARGFLAKDADPVDLLAGIRQAAGDGAPFSPHVLKRLVSRAVSGSRRTAAEGLTGRELDVLRLVVEGRSNAEIASALYLGPTTVKSHLASLLAKTGAANRVQLAVKAVREGWEP
ncbi:response regulator [Salininema proteolyticum]|uniref:Response regulator n=1 Tax=Salininema proteolyticum TaxID=1607685 RepID=A0ABV8TZZ2_9ACTN